jgi:type VI secretion system secreted protein Hcp
MAVDAFLKIADIQGESQDSVFKNAIEVLSFSWGATSTAHVAGGGLSSGKPVLADFAIMKHYDKSSPKFFTALVTGQHIASIAFSTRKVGGGKSGGYVYLTFTLANALVTSAHLSGGTDVATESISFAYQKITIEYFLQTTSGSVGSTGSVSFDVSANLST